MIDETMNELLELEPVDKLIVAVLSLLTSVTIGGNLLVMLAIILEPRLRQNITNCFILSLAAADLLLGTVVMPFAIVEYWRHKYAELTYRSNISDPTFEVWPYGQDWCDTWHAFDVLSCTASILNLCVISVERYIAVSDPVSYQTRMTHSRSIIMIAGAWICSALISFPAIAWWRFSLSRMTLQNVQPLNATKSELVTVSETDCIFPEDQLYLFLSSCVSFHIPLIVMIILYWRIYRSAIKVLKSLERGVRIINNGDIVIRVHRGGSYKPIQKQHNGSASRAAQSTVPTEFADRHPVGSNSSSDIYSSDRMAEGEISLKAPPIFAEYGENKGSVDRRVRFVKSTSTNPVNTVQPSVRCNCQSCCGCASFVFRCRGSCHTSESTTQPVSPNDKIHGIFRFKKRLNRFLQEKRAAKTLGIIMGVFIFCWLPFSIYNTIKSIHPSFTRKHESILFPLLTWLGYVNSSINPFIYAYSIRDIRRGFIHIFCMFRRNNWNQPTRWSISTF